MYKFPKHLVPAVEKFTNQIDSAMATLEEISVELQDTQDGREEPSEDLQELIDEIDSQNSELHSIQYNVRRNTGQTG